jgi:UDPglucose 6-dehydrogenase
MKINIIGAGFVGLTLAEVLSGQSAIEKITVIDIDENKIKAIKEGKLPVSEKDLTLKSDKLVFASEYTDADGDIFFICVGTPNDYSKQEGTPISVCAQITDYLDSAVKAISDMNKSAVIIIKSTTLPENVLNAAKLVDPLFGKVITNPEFLAEGKAVDDMRHQSQLIVGSEDADREFSLKLMSEIFEGTYDEIFGVGLREAMVIKYFVNSYKAQKLNFINDFNRYCEHYGMSFKQVIESVKDPVFGEGFDKPGVGFGGSCFPKDTAAMGSYIPSCRAAFSMNEMNIEAFANSFEIEDGSIILIGGKAFKNGTNDTRESVACKVADIWKDKWPAIHIYFYDQLPELSDLTLEEIKEKKDKFDLVVVFNDLPELDEIFSEGYPQENFINTRKVS